MNYSIRGKSHLGAYVLFIICMIGLMFIDSICLMHAVDKDIERDVDERITMYGLDGTGLSNEEKEHAIYSQEELQNQIEAEKKQKMAEQGLTKEHAIMSVNDIPQNVLDKAISNLNDFLDAKLANENDFRHIVLCSA